MTPLREAAEALLEAVARTATSMQPHGYHFPQLEASADALRRALEQPKHDESCAIYADPAQLPGAGTCDCGLEQPDDARDAARYRWLRAQQYPKDHAINWWHVAVSSPSRGYGQCFNGEQIDFAIDAAMREEK